VVQRIEQIIYKQGLWPNHRLNAQCEGFKCMLRKTDCCCQRLLFMQSDFVNQKSHLEELITSQGHICDFYPKYHCELNFIEQYWGAAKFHYHTSPKMDNIDKMEKNVRACFNDMPIFQIKWFGISFHAYQLLLSNRGFLSDMPTDQPVLSMCTHRVCQALRPHGQIGSITAIGASHLIFSLT